MNPILINLACVPDPNDEDIAALRASADAIEAALVEAEQEDNRRAVELNAARARIVELETQLAAVPRSEICSVLRFAGGELREMGLRKDANAVWCWLTQEGVRNDPMKEGAHNG